MAPNISQPFPSPVPPNQNPSQVGSIPPGTQLSPDLVGQGYVGGALPSIRIMPASANANAAINAISETVQQNVTNVVIPTIPPPAFGTITTGRNIQATMIVGTGAILTYTNFYVPGGQLGATAFIQGEAVVQSGSGATSVVTGFFNGQLQLGPIVGVANATGVWTGSTSGALYGPTTFPVADSGVVNANEVGTINVDGNVPTHAGQLLISQPGNEAAVWADPQVQGLYAAGSSIASPPVYSVPTTICPVGVGGSDNTGKLQFFTQDASKNLNVNISAVSIGGSSLPVSGTLTNNNAAPSTNNLGVLGMVANAADPLWTEGDLVVGSVTLAGYQRVILHAETTKVIGTVNQGTSPWVTADTVLDATVSAGKVQVLATQVTSPWVTNVSQFGGSNVVTGLGASGAGIPRVTVSNDSEIQLWDGTTRANVIVATNALKTDLSSVAGTATVTVAAGVQEVGIVGSTGHALETTAGVLDTNIKNVGNSAVVTAAAGVQVVGVADSAGNKITSNSATQSRSLDVNIVSSLGATNSKTNGSFFVGTNNTDQWTIKPTNTASVDADTSVVVQLSPKQPNLDIPLNVTFSGTTFWGTAPSTSTLVAGVNAELFGGQIALTAKAASTVSVAGDTSLVTQISPNQPTAMMVGTAPGTSPGNTVVTGGIYNTSAPTFTNGQTGPLQLNVNGALLVAPSSGAFGNITQWNSVNLGSPSNFGTSPGTVASPGVNASVFAGTTALTATGGNLNVNIASQQSSALAIIQQSSAVNAGSSKTVSVSGFSPTKFNNIIVEVGAANFAASNFTLSISDGINTYVQDVIQGYTGAGPFCVAVFRATNVTGGPLTITVTQSGSNSANSFMWMNVYEVQGGTLSVDITSTGTSVSSPVTTSAVLPVQTNELAFAAAAFNSVSGTGTANNGFTLDYSNLQASGNTAFAATSLLIQVPGTVTGSISQSGAAVHNVIAMVVYRIIGTSVSGVFELVGQGNAATVAHLTNSNPLAVEIVDGNGTQITNFGGANVGATGSAVPASAGYEGINVAGNLRGATGVNPSGTIYAQQMDIASVAGTTVNTAAAGTILVGLADGSNNKITSNQTTQSRSLDVNIVSVIGATHSKTNTLFDQISDGTNTMGAMTNFGTTPTAVKALVANVSVFVGTAAPSASNALFTQVTDGTNAAGAFTNFGTTPTAVKALAANVSVFHGTAAPSASNTDFNQISDGTNALGAFTNFGTTPTAVKAVAANVSVFYGTTAASNQTAGIPDVNIKNIGNTAISNQTAGIIDFNLKNIGNSAVSATAAQIGAAIINIGASVQSVTNPLFVKTTDGTTGITVKAAATATVIADTAEVVTLSPNVSQTPIVTSATGTGAANASFTISLTSCAAGNSIVVIVGGFNQSPAPLITVTDPTNGAYGRVIYEYPTFGAGTSTPLGFQVFVFTNQQASGSLTITVNAASANGRYGAIAYQLAGNVVVDQVRVAGTSANVGTTSGTASTPMFAANFPGSLALFAAINDAGNTFTGGTGWTNDASNLSFGFGIFSAWHQAASGAYSPTATLTASSWAAICLSVKTAPLSVSGNVGIIGGVAPIDGQKLTYRCSVRAFTTVSDSAKPFFSLQGSATKTIRITHIRYTMSDATGATTPADVSLQRFSVLTGGVTANTPTLAQMDMADPAGTAIALQYSTVPSTATAVGGIIAVERFQLQTGAAASNNIPSVEWTFGQSPGARAIVLRGTADYLGIVQNGVGTTPVGDLWIEWTEE